MLNLARDFSRIFHDCSHFCYIFQFLLKKRGLDKRNRLAHATHNWGQLFNTGFFLSFCDIKLPHERLMLFRVSLSNLKLSRASKKRKIWCDGVCDVTVDIVINSVFSVAKFDLQPNLAFLRFLKTMLVMWWVFYFESPTNHGQLLFLWFPRCSGKAANFRFHANSGAALICFSKYWPL